jgi:uncharacterized protein YndB with AHSA1/START domain
MQQAATDKSAVKNETIVERTSDRELTVTRTFNAPAHIVFDAWTKPEFLKLWWAPKSFGVSLFECEQDVRVGGAYRFAFGRDPNHPEVFSGRYVEVKPPLRLVLTQIGTKTPPLFRPAALSISMLSISGEGNGRQTTTKRNAHQAEAGDHHHPGRSLGDGRHRAAADGEVLSFGSSNILERGRVEGDRRDQVIRADQCGTQLNSASQVGEGRKSVGSVVQVVDWRGYVKVRISDRSAAARILIAYAERIGRNGQRRARDRAGKAAEVERKEIPDFAQGIIVESIETGLIVREDTSAQIVVVTAIKRIEGDTVDRKHNGAAKIKRGAVKDGHGRRRRVRRNRRQAHHGRNKRGEHRVRNLHVQSPLLTGVGTHKENA